MQGDDVELARRLAEELGDRVGDELVADAVEAVLAELVLARHVRVNGVGADVLGQRGVELRVKAGHVDGLGQLLDARLDDLEGGRIVQRRQVRQRLEAVVRVLGDELRLGEAAAVDDAVAGDGDVFGPADLPELPVLDQRPEQDPERVVLGLDRFRVRHLFVLAHHLAPAHVLELGGRGGEAAQLRLGDLRRRLALLLGRVGRDLDRAGARVDRQYDLHDDVNNP